ncbi:MAG: ATP-binding protein [Bacteroidales bacterium]|nr:ATP-binding protein [Bacteroidales bacterium]
MILDLSISNFRSIKDRQTISFIAESSTHLDDYYVVKKSKYRILKLISILGPNASGKSNFLRGFQFLRRLVIHPLENKGSKIQYEPFLLDDDYKNAESSIEINFICGDSKFTYSLQFNNNFILKEIITRQGLEDLRAHKVLDRTTDIEKGIAYITWGNKYRNTPNKEGLLNNLLPNRTVFGAYMKSNVDIPWMKEVCDWFGEYMLPNIDPHNQNLQDFVAKEIHNGKINHALLKDLLKKADIGVADLTLEVLKTPIPKEVLEVILNDDDLPSDVRERLSSDPTSTDYRISLLHNGPNGPVALKFEDESEGTQRYFELSGILLKMVQENHFLAIDELECRLHPDLYRYFITSFLSNSHESQLIFTTHLREFLYSPEDFRMDSVWFAEKDSQGATELYSLAHFDKRDIKELPNLFWAYKTGRLGAVPSLGDTGIN